MAVELMLEKWSGEVSTVTIGAARSEAGTRSRTIKVGGQKALPFLFAEGAIPNRPVIAYEIWDIMPADWPQELISSYGGILNDPLAWAEKCVRDHKAQLLCIRLQGAHPEFGNKSAEQEAKLIAGLLKKTDVPIIILGCVAYVTFV